MHELTAVNRTALGVASIRAQETTRQDRLLDDPYAASLSAGYKSLPTTNEAGATQRKRLQAHIVLRTRWYDEVMLAAAIPQVVILAAGLDARAWRLPWAVQTTTYELDQPEVLAYKAERLAEVPRCSRRAVPADLRDPWPASLLAAGFEPGRPTAWLAEGLLAYLDAEECLGLLKAVTILSASGSVVACERTGPMRRLPTTVSALWRGGLPDGATDALIHLGWTATEVDTRELARRWTRPDLADVEGQLVSARL